MAKFLPQGEDQVLIDEKVKERTEVKKPQMYKVLLHNDDYTTMEFVVLVLMRYFAKNETAATEVMLRVHQSGIGIAGVYTYEIAETKVLMVTEDARRHEFPLKCSLEPAE